MSLSYQHIYHAGNLADIHKHLWLIAVLSYLTKKDKPLCWLDAHGGRGMYDLLSVEAQKTAEVKEGIWRVLPQMRDCPYSLWKCYTDLIKTYNPVSSDSAIQYYPGSSVIAAHLIKSKDRLIVSDLHPAEFRHLTDAMHSFKHCTVIHEDMNVLCKRIIPPQERRGGILFDPSYDIKTEYQTVPELMLTCYKKWSNAVLMLWYPILSAGRHERLKSFFSGQQHTIPVLICEWYFSYARQSERGIQGSGMVIINPPYTVPEQMAQITEIFKNRGIIL